MIVKLITIGTDRAELECHTGNVFVRIYDQYFHVKSLKREQDSLYSPLQITHLVRGVEQPPFTYKFRENDFCLQIEVNVDGTPKRR